MSIDIPDLRSVLSTCSGNHGEKVALLSLKKKLGFNISDLKTERVLLILFEKALIWVRFEFALGHYL